MLIDDGVIAIVCRIERDAMAGLPQDNLSALTGNPVALSLVHPAAKKAAWPGEFRRETSRSTAGQRRGGRLLVMLWAAHKGSLRSAAH
jgi:hypothetical protein